MIFFSILKGHTYNDTAYMTKYYDIFIKLGVCMLVEIYIVELALNVEHMYYNLSILKVKWSNLMMLIKPQNHINLG